MKMIAGVGDIGHTQLGLRDLASQWLEPSLVPKKFRIITDTELIFVRTVGEIEIDPPREYPHVHRGWKIIKAYRSSKTSISWLR